jgi:hypothetical protein
MSSRIVRIIISGLAGVGTTLLVGLLLASTTGANSWVFWIFSLAGVDRLLEPGRYSSYAYEGYQSWIEPLLPFVVWSPIFALLYYHLLTKQRETI